jgi:hypothetical protein
MTEPPETSPRLVSRRSLVLGLIGAAGVSLSPFAARAKAAVRAAAYAWLQGDERAYIGRVDGTNDLSLYAMNDLNVLAGHVRIGGIDGNFEFENESGTSRLIAYRVGTATRTPIAIGADGNGEKQDIVPLIVDGQGGQQSDLQQWRSGGKVVAAIDAQGRFRLGPGS